MWSRGLKLTVKSVSKGVIFVTAIVEMSFKLWMLVMCPVPQPKGPHGS